MEGAYIYGEWDCVSMDGHLVGAICGLELLASGDVRDLEPGIGIGCGDPCLKRRL